MVYRWEGGNQVMEGEDLTLRDDLVVGDDLTVGWNATITGTLSVNWGEVITGWVVLAAWEDLVGSSTSDITINTDKFTVAWATGNTAVKGTFTATGASTLTGAVTASNGIIVGSAKKIEGAWTGANGVVLKNLKNAATSELSGTALDVEIDIGWTPYHFHVYPTKA